MANFKKLLLSLCILLLFCSSITSKAANVPALSRLGGTDRYETAIQISNDGGQQSDYIVIVSGLDFPDALCATPLAKKYNSPILPVSGKSLSSDMVNEIARLRAQHAIIVGGTGAVSQGIENQLKNLNIETTRVYGNDRYETSSKVAQLIGSANGVVLASGQDFPDALSIAPIAGFKQMPILLTNSDVLPQSIESFIRSNNTAMTYVVGGNAVISNSAIKGISKYKRLSGDNRYTTNLAVINEFINEIDFSSVYIATGEDYPDALSGSASASNSSSPIILAYNKYYAASDLIKSRLDSISRFKVLGGVGVLSDSVVQKIMRGEPITKKIVLGFTTYDYVGDTSSYNSMYNNIGSIDEIATYTFHVDGSGNIAGNPPSNQLELAKNNNIEALALITNDFNKEIGRAVLESSSARHNLINNILNQLKANNYKGVNIDFENLYNYDRNYYTTFLSELYNTLHAQNYTVTVAVPAKTVDNVSDKFTGAYDYKQIANYSDQVAIMTYDEHYSSGPPGPIASIGWVQKVASYALSTIPKEKVLLGVAAYGYDWSSSGTKARSVEQIYDLASIYNIQMQWDPVSQCPYFIYTDKNGVKHEVWFENGTSIGYKLDLVNKSDLAGIAIWRLGYEDSAYWAAISSKFN